MKALRNPLVTGALVVVAVATVGYQFLPSVSHAFQTPTPPAPAIALPGTAPVRAEVEEPRPTVPIAPKLPLPVQPIDTNYGPAHMIEWADSPRRDPFFLVPVVQSKAVHQYPSPVLKWKLKGIWRQTGGRFAAINHGVYGEGDSIDGFKIEKIDDDQVWVQGPDRLERLGFDKTEPGVFANERFRSPAPPSNKLQPRSEFHYLSIRTPHRCILYDL